MSAADKYAVFSSLGTDTATASSGGTVNWTGSSTPSGAVDWSGGSKGGANVFSGGGIDWGPGSNTNIKQPPTSDAGLMSSGMPMGE